MPKTAVLIPCHNEEKTIGKVVRDFKTTLPDATIYVCDNAGTDNTAHEAEQAGAVVFYEPRLGKGYALKRLFKEVEADIFIIVDGDDTYDAANSLEMIRNIKRGDDMVIVDRLSTTYFDVNSRHFHNFGNRLVVKSINLIFRSKIKDIMSGYRALSKRFVANFPFVSNGFEIETEMTIHALNFDFNISQIAGNYRERPEGSTSKLKTFSDGAKVLKTITRLFRTYRPFAFFSILSLILMLIALILFIPIFIDYFETGLVPRFPTLIVSSSIALFSILMFITGIVLNTISKNTKFVYNLMLLHYDDERK